MSDQNNPAEKEDAMKCSVANFEVMNDRIGVLLREMD